MIDYEELYEVVDHFARREGKQKSVQFDTGIGSGELRYIRWKNKKYQKLLSDMFGVADAYKRWKSDFIIFYLQGEPVAAGTYTLWESALEVDEVEDLVKTIYNELLLTDSIARKITQHQVV